MTNCQSTNNLLDPRAFRLSLENNPEVVLLDVRTQEEFEAGHIENALNIDYKSADFEDQLLQLDNSLPYLIYCKSGGRSASAAIIMKELGFTNVQELDGGILAWNKATIK